MNKCDLLKRKKMSCQTVSAAKTQSRGGGEK